MNLLNNSWLKKGFVDEAVDSSVDFVKEIELLKKEKNAVVMAHYYQDANIQDVADIIGDSLALAQRATSIDADIILLAGVHFMGETVKILNPEKKVLIPDMNAGCSLADSCKRDDFAAFIAQNPDHKVISYVNTSADIKALTDVVVTSSNALKVVDSFSKDEKIIFGPDRNLGRYINEMTGRNMKLWNGACHVHQRFSFEKISLLSKQYPDAAVICHPECEKELVYICDFVGSTAALLNYVGSSDKTTFIVATEAGILHQMQKSFPNKLFISAPSSVAADGCNCCEYMRMNTLQKLYLTLKYEWPEVVIEKTLADKARVCIDNMLRLS